LDRLIIFYCKRSWKGEEYYNVLANCNQFFSKRRWSIGRSFKNWRNKIGSSRIRCRKAFFIAIGHSQDRNVSLLEKVCDYAYHTPSALGTQFGEDLKTEREKEDLRQELSSLVQNLKNENEILKNKANKVYVYMIAGIVVGIVVGIALASIILKS